MERQSKGIWFPIEIWEAKDLSWSEKILLLEIDSFTSKKKDCFISNEYIANLLKVTETTANKILSSLIKKGYVIKTSFDGRRRSVKSALTFEARQGCFEEQGRVANESNIPIIIDTNINIPKEEIDKSISKKECINFTEVQSKWEKLNPSLPTIRYFSDKRKNALRKLLKDNNATIEDLYKVFKIISACSFCQGNNDRKWIATLDWVLNDTKGCFNRLLEGVFAFTEEEKQAVQLIAQGENINSLKNTENEPTNLVINGQIYR